MQPREKILAAIVGGLLVALVGVFGYSRLSAVFETRRARVTALEIEVAKKQAQVEAGKRAVQRFADWEDRALPADVELSRTLYQNWLVKQLDQVKLRNGRVEPGREATHRDKLSKQVVYHAIPFTVQGRGTLEQGVQWLYAMYTAGHLHLLRNVSFKPVEGGKELDFEFTIEAMSLPGATRKTLTDKPGTQLAIAELEPYVKTIVERNLFAQYQPPPPPRPKEVERPAPPPPPAYNLAKHAVLTAVVQVGQRPQAWFSVRTSGEVLKLSEGDKLDVGQFHGTVARIGVKDVEIDRDGQRKLVSMGESLQ